MIGLYLDYLVKRNFTQKEIPMEFVATHNSIDLNELVMVKDGVVYRQDDYFLDVEPVGYSWEFNKDYLLPLKGD